MIEMIIHLPDGKVFKAEAENVKRNVPLTLEAVVSARDFFSNADCVQIPVEPENPLVKKEFLVLYGDTLKNSYVVIRDVQ